MKLELSDKDEGETLLAATILKLTPVSSASDVQKVQEAQKDERAVTTSARD